MKKNFRIFLDMDNVLTDFGDVRNRPDILEKMSERGFFLNLNPLPFLHEMNKVASLFPENIFIISACINSPYCKEEKIEWLKKYLPAACKENVIFTETGKKKSLYVSEKYFGSKRRKISKYDILIDDYSKNIVDWEKRGGTAIKFRNNFNNGSGNNSKYVISDFTELLDVLEVVRDDLK